MRAKATVFGSSALCIPSASSTSVRYADSATWKILANPKSEASGSPSVSR